MPLKTSSIILLAFLLMSIGVGTTPVATLLTYMQFYGACVGTTLICLILSGVFYFLLDRLMGQYRMIPLSAQKKAFHYALLSHLFLVAGLIVSACSLLISTNLHGFWLIGLAGSLLDVWLFCHLIGQIQSSFFWLVRSILQP